MLRTRRAGALACAILFIGFAASAQDASRVAAAGAGNCSDPELIDATRAIGRKLAQQGRSVIVAESELVRAAAGDPARAREVIEKRIEAARQQYYEGQYARAMKQVDSALQEIARQRPGLQRWQLEVKARLLEGLVRIRLDGETTDHEAFRRVLRLEQTHQLDPDYFGPSTIQLFENVRREVLASTRHELEVTSTPASAEVFLDGRPVGRTPLRAAFPEGTYQLVVGDGDILSLERSVHLGEARTVHVDLDFERTVQGGQSLCFSGAAGAQARLKSGLKLGAMLELDQVVVVRLHRPAEGSQHWLAAALIDVGAGEEIREGALQLAAGEGASDARLGELARFVTTGEQTPNVIPAPPASESLPPVSAPEADTDNVASVPIRATPDLEIDRSPTLRPAAFAAGGLGAAAAATGIVFLVLSERTRAELSGLGDPIPATEAAQARFLVDELKARQAIAYTGLGFGALAIAGGAWLYIADREAAGQAPLGAIVLPTPSGATFALSGSF